MHSQGYSSTRQPRMAGTPQPSYKMITSHPAALSVPHTTMSASQTSLKENRNILTPPSRFEIASVTPPPTDEKAFTQISRVLALFRLIKAGNHVNQNPWTSFQLAQGDYDEIERQLSQDVLVHKPTKAQGQRTHPVDGTEQTCC